MNNNINERQPPSEFFDRIKPPNLANPDPAGGHLHPSQYENGNLSRQPIKSDDHRGEAVDYND
jgi:hypothetical protein